jgi:DNA-binding NtrC family response regulator
VFINAFKSIFFGIVVDKIIHFLKSRKKHKIERLVLAHKVLIVEDNKYLAAQYNMALKKYGFDGKIVTDSDEFFDCYQKFEPNVIVINIKLRYSTLNGIQITRALVYDYKTSAKIIVISAEATTLQIKEIRKLGVYTFIEKGANFNLNYLIVNIENAIKHSENEDENKNLLFHNRNLKKQILNKHPFIGNSKRVVNVKGDIVNLAIKEEPVIFYGDPGSGKHVAVNFYYNNSSRFGMPYAPINCRKLSNEIDYQVKQSHKSKTEIIEEKLNQIMAENLSGIVHFEELANLSNGIQLIITKYIESAKADREIPLVLFTTSFSPHKLKAKRLLNSKLCEAVGENVIRIPSLKSRGKDYLTIMEHYLKTLCEQYYIEYEADLPKIHDEISEYTWPGNVVEVKNFCKNVVFAGKCVNNDTILEVYNKLQNKKDCDNCVVSLYNIPDLRSAMTNFEKHYIQRRLVKNNWKITHTARELQIERTTLYKKMRQYDIEKEK